MHSFTNVLFIAAASLPSVFAAAADPLGLATVKAQFTNAKIVPDAIPTFNPSALLNVNYASSVGVISVGQVVPKDDTAERPLLTANGTLSGSYTVMIIDADYVGAPTDTAGLNVHWLQNDLTASENGTLTTASPARVAYAGPGPASGSGPHRYTVLLYSQGSSFAAPATPAAGSSVQRIHLADYVKAAGFSDPVAASYFTVEVGTSTVTVESTSAVNTATLSVASSSSAAASGSASASASASGSASATGSRTSSAATGTPTTQPSGAGKMEIGMGAFAGAILTAMAVLA
jgi:hypothetical protein